MVRTACIMMQKDETLLLEPWLKYHGYIFGYENIYVYDNGSEIAAIRDTLEKYELLGVTVDYGYGSPKDFDNKGVIVGSLIEVFEIRKEYDLVIPCDCDEFLALCGPKGISVSRQEISDQLEKVSAGGKEMVKISHCLENRPGSLNVFRLTSFNKTIVPLGDFARIDHGFHEAKAKSTSEYRQCDLIYIHLHFKPFEMVKAHAREKLRPFVDTSNFEALKSYTGVGRHLIRFFFMSEAFYYQEVGLDESYPYPLIKFDSFRFSIEMLMNNRILEKHWGKHPEFAHSAKEARELLDMTGVFDAVSYSLANFDVATSTMNPTIHYCLFGFREKRRLSSA